MPNFLLVYYDGKPPATKAEGDKVMADWMDWFKSLGKAVVDMGNPTKPGKMVSNSGVSAVGRNPVTGYTIVKADTLEKAVEIAKSGPHLASGGQVAVYEVMPM